MPSAMPVHNSEPAYALWGATAVSLLYTVTQSQLLLRKEISLN